MTSRAVRHLGSLLAAAMLCGAAVGQAPAQRPDTITPSYNSAGGGSLGRAPATHPEKEECKRLRAEYASSRACFEPFQNAKGTRPEAYAKCGKGVPDPAAVCGPPTTP